MINLYWLKYNYSSFRDKNIESDNLIAEISIATHGQVRLKRIDQLMFINDYIAYLCSRP